MDKKKLNNILVKLTVKTYSITEASNLIMELSNPKAKETKVSADDIKAVYSAYPTKCVVRGVHSGKGSANKRQIARLLKDKTREELISTIEKYVSECRRGKVYMKNFSTFLNNLPDFGDSPTVTAPIMDGATRNIRAINELQ